MAGHTSATVLPWVDAATVATTGARLAAWNATAWDREVHLGDDGSTRLDLAYSHQAVPFVARIAGSPSKATTIEIDAAAVTTGEAWLSGAIRSVTERLGWHDDLTAFWRDVTDDPALAEASTALRHLRLVRHASPFEALAWAIVRQRTPHGFAVASLHRLRNALGRSFRAGTRPWTSSPEPREVAADDARVAILDATGNVRKTDRLHAAATEFAALDVGALITLPLDEARRVLSRLTGVGPWTVDYVLLMGIGRLDHVPWTDTGLARAASAVYAGGWLLEPGDLTRLAAHYPAHGGMWAHLIKRVHHGLGGY